MRRALGIAAGVVTHAAFVATVWLLYGFLKGGNVSTAEGALWVDFLLALQFGIVHSVLLLPVVRNALAKWIASPFYGLFYCAATCGCLMALFGFWRTSPVVWWELRGPALWAVDAGWFGSWAALLYSLSLNGLGYQTGWTPWWRWVRRLAHKPRLFRPRGAYLLVRHPVYLSFLGLVWFTPVMTTDRAILTAVWTAYLFIGSWLTDRRMAGYIGDPYREYLARVPGYPGMFFGPLGKRARPAPAMHSCSPVSGRPQERYCPDPLSPLLPIEQIHETSPSNPRSPSLPCSPSR